LLIETGNLLPRHDFDISACIISFFYGRPECTTEKKIANMALAPALADHRSSNILSDAGT
jgi:hypothetical protein